MIRPLKHLSLLVCLMLLLPAVSVSQECQIKGTIVCKETSEKLSEVKIEVYEGDLLYKIIKSDTAGRYDTGKFKLIHKNLSFLVAKQGYEAYKILFSDIKQNSITFINFNLEKLTEARVKEQQEEQKKAINNPQKFKRKYYKVKRM
ncbi:MAG TPA: hypothetical protein PKN75_05610 [Bacteroidia bacterium]|nr:hypothetical protein [Bacteroidia bacterium]HNU33051.1 hypothetical protein [Bacteroidia bacterium]